jgi:phosphate:Na+ symporter
MTFHVLLDAFGGLALFLLAMSMMTEGLKAFAGAGLRRLLENWTSTPLRGVFVGALVTGLVQSSSAVTVATIGFVNSGMLPVRQALGVIYGTNVGTTMTGWLVSLAGVGLRIESFALPIVATGMVVRLVSRGRRARGLGDALVGFGIFFLGLSILKSSFAGMAASYEAAVIGGAGSAGWPAAIVAGFVATVLTQSSSAAIAIILTAAGGGVLHLDSAAAAVIGANLGTTSTAALAVLTATPAAKRLALGHILFNLITGAVAIALLPLMLGLVARIADSLDVDGSPAMVLALFHTVFNVSGVLLLLPMTGRVALFLERLFRSEAENLARPQHLDSTLAATPELAVAALQKELERMRGIVARLARDATGEAAGDPASVAAGARPGPGRAPRRAPRVGGVGAPAAGAGARAAAVTGFLGSLRTEAMPRDVGDRLAHALRTNRYLEEVARLAPRAYALGSATGRATDVQVQAALGAALAAARACFELAALADQGRTPGAPNLPAAFSAADAARAEALHRFAKAYEEAKVGVLGAAVLGAVEVDEADTDLDALSATRRMVEQLVKADRMLRSPDRGEDIEAEQEAGESAGAH